MDKVEEYIDKYTMRCSNELYSPPRYEYEIKIKEYEPWLTPEHVRNVAQISREETIKEVYEWLNENLPIYISYCKRGVGEGSTEFIEDLKKHLKNRV